ncbi:alpha/beta hydrolase [Thalassovita taeanensis]|uniref:Lysophospholipase, alpha-beta hydrolase superfamily n=1 Tax=Thalassovita taeanensis TaxID=657014 RepID=A0A1H9HN52_9RHOB|nr:alpha/beta fold hydrolase [Thalassovita taeanensis]SEQ63754.1 Lysophospholipase, alpha-beta hydrolase superfamily [Thalassovita taeanensis]
MLGKVLGFVGISAGISLSIALGLIASQRPGSVSARAMGEGGLDFTRQMSGGAGVLQVTPVSMRDGFDLTTRHLPGPEGAPLLVLVHGSGWYGAQFDGLARALSDQAEVLVPDLRGHGAAPRRRGDVDHIGQLEEDLADLIRAYAKTGQKVIMLGHSSGGGLVVRFAGGAYGDLLGGAVLLAPFLKYNAPTTRTNSGGWARPLTRRIIGLTMLNAARIRMLNHLTVIQFAMPQAVLDGPLGHMATTAYSYRMNTSYAPRPAYEKDIAALPPFLLIAGTADEAFVADAYEPLMTQYSSKGRYHLIEGVSHLDVVNAPQTQTLIRGFLNEL